MVNGCFWFPWIGGRQHITPPKGNNLFFFREPETTFGEIIAEFPWKIFLNGILIRPSDLCCPRWPCHEPACPAMRESFAKARSWWSKPSKIHGISKRKSLPSWDEWYDETQKHLGVWWICWKSFFLSVSGFFLLWSSLNNVSHGSRLGILFPGWPPKTPIVKE